MLVEFGETRRVRDEIAEAALEGRGLHGDDRIAVERHVSLVAVALGIGLQFVQELGHVGRLGLLAGVGLRPKLPHVAAPPDEPAQGRRERLGEGRRGETRSNRGCSIT